MKINYYLKEDCPQQLNLASENVVVIANKHTFQTWEVLEELCKDLVATDEEKILIKSVGETLEPSRDFPSSSELWLAKTEQTSKPRRVVLCALPTDCSRHNSPAKPHAITQLVNANKGSGSLVVLLIVDDASHAFAAGCAVARPFHLFTDKGIKKTFSVGDRVIAKYPPYHGKGDNPWFAGVITGINGGSASIRFDDGDIADEVTPQVILYAPSAPSNVGKGSHRFNDFDEMMNSYEAGERFSVEKRVFSQSSDKKVDVIFNVGVADVQADFIPKMCAVADAIRLAARLVDAPPCVVHTDYMVEEARAVSEEVGAQFEIIQGTELDEKGYGGIWGIGKAAERPPALVILSHVPEGSNPQKAVVLVGKGIIYDTGGLSIKTKTGMPGMKRDMGGAAGLLGAFKAIVQGGCAVPLYCLLCLAENSINHLAVRPDDILHMLSGKTVEINNTDAEGRVVLADGVAHAVAHLNPHIIIDMATLTGAQGVSTGNRIASLYCNDEGLEVLATQAGRSSGDLCHAMPFCPEFFRSEFKSAVADMKNSVKDRVNAQVSCAGQFIGNHLGDYLYNGKWLHIDMAYPSYSGERATGYGVALVFEMLQLLQKDA